MAGLQRMVAEVNSTVDAIIATHHMISLHELEQLLLASNRSFEGIGSFDALRLGSLRFQPSVMRHFPSLSLGPTPPPRVESVEVMAYIAQRLEEGWEANKGITKPLDVEQALHEYATLTTYCLLLTTYYLLPTT